MRARLFPGLSNVPFIEDDDEWERREAEVQRGDFEVETAPNGQRTFWICCPGCKGINPLTLRPVLNGAPQSWELSGAADAPTLSPSVNHVGCWHGWLRDGEWTSC